MNRVNPAAVVVSGIVFWLIQAGWYTAFRGPYVAALGMTEAQVQQAQQNMSFIPYLTALLSDILIAYVISLVMVRSGRATVSRGLIVALVLWGGILMTSMATGYSFEQRPTALLAINGGAQLVGMLLCGILCGAWTKEEKARMGQATSA